MNHLHVHTEYSLLDGMCKIETLLDKAKEYGMDSVAITDHGVLYGVLDFYDQCKKKGIHPIIGLEAYITEDRTIHSKEQIAQLGYDTYHLILLAKNNAGYKNLLKIVTDSYLNGFFSKPRTDMSFLRDHSEGLIALSACVAGQVPDAILKNDLNKAKALIEEYRKVFGADFYLEAQANTMPEQAFINMQLAKFSKELNIPMVITCDAHYINQDDAFAQEVLLAAQTNQIVGSARAMRMPTNDFWFKSEQEVVSSTPALTDDEIREAIANTHRIAEQCDVTIEFGNNLLPTFETPDGSSLEDYLSNLCDEALMRYYLQNDIDYYAYKERLDYELSVINGAGFPGYFLIVSDFIQWGKDQGLIFGPGRGSAAGSLVAYLLRITDPHMDPIKNGLLFERFLNPERREMPDIDVDVHPEDRYKVIEYIRQKYGQDNVAQIGTLGRMATKGVIKKVGGALGIEYSVRDAIAKLIPEAKDMEDEEERKKFNLSVALRHSPELQEYQKQYPELFRIAMMIEGAPSNSSIHAGGVVIAPYPISEYAPLQLGRDDEIVTQFTMGDIAKLGLLKVDVLGLKTLAVIDDALRMAKQEDPFAPNVEDIGTDDREPYQMLCDVETEGIFQVESDMFKRIIKGMHPSTFEEWVDLVALGRPGPLLSGMVEQYCRRKKGEDAVTYVHPKLEPILKDTYGVMVYQEQIMEICRALAGYTMGEADKVRSIMGKKKVKELPEAKKKFLSACEKHGEDMGICEQIWNDMAFFAEYCFNKPHAACYALTSYRTMWLKWKYPASFMASILTNECTGGAKDKESDKTLAYINRAKAMGIEILPPDINKSESYFSTEGGKIRMGLTAIANVGVNAIDQILGCRPFTDINDFDSRVNNHMVNKRMVTALIYSGAWDWYNTNRHSTFKKYMELRKARNLDKKEDLSLIPTKWTRKDTLQAETEYLGFPVTVTTKWDRCKEGDPITIGGIVERYKEHTTKNGKLMGFVDIDTEEGKVNALLFLEQWLKVNTKITIGSRIVIKGKKSEGKLVAREVHIEEGIDLVDAYNATPKEDEV